MSVRNFFSFAVFLVTFLILCSHAFTSCGVWLCNYSTSVASDFFMFDSLSFYLVILVSILGVFSWCWTGSHFKVSTKWFLLLSLAFSGCCFCVNHSILFWCLYELSMLPLLYLIFKDSPYSERFIAGWYFAVYLVVTSLPLVLILIYLSSVNGSPLFSDWSYGTSPFTLYVLLSFIFFTKVPLSPFHTWLPIVHAEATSIVSIFLSGYIMKLGLLGVFRCSPFIFSCWFYGYLFFCCVLSIFFIVTASAELDGKRWLAFLSLSHIVVSFLALYICCWDSVSLSFVFCLGHGLSAGLVFGFLWLCYEISSSRNWLLLKESVGGKYTMLVGVLSLLSLCSFPPTLQFFCEVNLLIGSGFSLIFIVFWSCYLFFGGLVPLILCGHLLIRSESVDACTCWSYTSFIFYLSLLCGWCYVGVFLL
uniref:NADH-ubiquinone oxidoreductase chain 4 n=1 Tax=Rhinebothrium sp. 1 TaxID=108307 RepID=A0A8K1SX71_9CEST|nr:NADH dehydrogenase subunit 4 [Rhinebothrium sp. 1]